MKFKILTLIIIFNIFIIPLNAKDILIFTRTEGKPHAGGFLMGELIIKEAYRRIGFQIELKEYPAERAIAVANNGSADGNLQRSAGAEKQYTSLVMVSFPIIYNEHVVFTKSKVFKVNGYDSLKPYKIAIFLGNKPTERGTSGMQVTLVRSPEQAFMMLESGRVDVFLYPREGICIVKELGLTEIKVLEPPIEKTPIYHYLNKRHSVLVPRLLAVLKEMEREGSIQRIRHESLIKLRTLCY